VKQVRTTFNNVKKAFPNILENITRDNAVNVNDHTILYIEHTAIILG